MIALLSMPTRADHLMQHDLPEARIAVAYWRAVEDNLGHDGFAALSSLLTPTQCEELAGCFFEEKRFRSRIVMERYAFGRGEYKYFSFPLPDMVGRLSRAMSASVRCFKC